MTERFIGWCLADRRVLWDLWVLVTPRAPVTPRLAEVRSGPEYTHMDGHAVDEVWTMHDGTSHHVADLHVVDMDAVIVAGRRVADELRGFRCPPPADIDAVRWAARLGYSVAAVDQLSENARRSLLKVHETWQEIWELEQAVREALEVSLPNLGTSLRWAAALEMARRVGCEDYQALDRVATAARAFLDYVFAPVGSVSDERFHQELAHALSEAGR